MYKGDLFPYEDKDQRYHFWSGFYTSRPLFKKQVRDYSNVLHSFANFYARAALNQHTTPETLSGMLSHMNEMADQLSVVQHHDAITGTHAQFVDTDYLFWLQRAFSPSKQHASKLMGRQVENLYGIKANGLKMCNSTSLNDTASDCPISGAKESIVII